MCHPTPSFIVGPVPKNPGDPVFVYHCLDQCNSSVNQHGNIAKATGADYDHSLKLEIWLHEPDPKKVLHVDLYPRAWSGGSYDQASLPSVVWDRAQLAYERFMTVDNIRRYLALGEWANQSRAHVLDNLFKPEWVKKLDPIFRVLEEQRRRVAPSGLRNDLPFTMSQTIVTDLQGQVFQSNVSTLGVDWTLIPVFGKDDVLRPELFRSFDSEFPVSSEVVL